MANVLLGEFIASNREELLNRCKEKVTKRSGPPPPAMEIDRGIPQFMDNLVNELNGKTTLAKEMMVSASQHGRNQFVDGFTVGQLVHDYGDICQSVTELAIERAATINPNDFRTLNRCLDDAIAGAVGEYTNQERFAGAGDSLRVRDLVYSALTAFEALQEGRVGVTGATADLVHRSLLALSALVDRPVP
jgi:hypothetical protein